MSDGRDFNREDLAYTSPAEGADFQYRSRLLPDDAPRKKNPEGRFVLSLILILLIAALSAGAILFLLRYRVAVTRSEEGIKFSITHRASTTLGDLMQLHPGLPQGGADAVPDRSPSYEWDGSTLDISAPTGGDKLSGSQIYRKCISSAVRVTAVDERGRSVTAAGIIATSNGAIIVNGSLLADAQAISVTHADREYEAYVIGLDYTTDLAVISIDAEGLTPAEFGRSDTLAAGEDIAVLGNPVADVLNYSEGVISAINSDFRYKGFPIAAIQLGIQLGNQAGGSMLLNGAGQVIGIISSDMGAQYPEAGDLAFAIPMSEAKPIIDELLEFGYVAGRPSSGLTVMEIPETYVLYYRYPSSIYISDVSVGSTAYEAGVRQGDLIISANGEKMSSMDALYSVINGLKAGDTLSLEIFREGEISLISFALMEAAVPQKIS